MLSAKEAALAHLRLPDSGAARAHAHFRLAQCLKAKGKDDEAAVHFAEANCLHPRSWNIFRQSAAKAGQAAWLRARISGHVSTLWARTPITCRST